MLPSKPRRTGTADFSIPDAAAMPSPKTAVPQEKRLRLVPQQTALPARPAGALAHGAEIDAQDVPSAYSLPADLEADLAAMDRDVLLSAVKTRLKNLTGADSVASMHMGRRRVTAARVCASVLGCVAALDRLHLMLTADAAHNRQLKLDRFDALAAPSDAGAAFGVGAAAGGQGRPTAWPDPLTLLPNRRGFFDRLRLALAEASVQRREFAVLTVYLEGFQAIQAALGVDGSDELLGIIAARLVRAVRSHDMVSRVHADEFGLFIGNLASREQLRRLTCKLFDAVAAPIAIGLHEVSVRPSFGIAMGPADGASGAALVRSASVALAHARRQGSGYVFFDERGKAWAPGRV